MWQSETQSYLIVFEKVWPPAPRFPRISSCDPPRRIPVPDSRVESGRTRLHPTIFFWTENLVGPGTKGRFSVGPILVRSFSCFIRKRRQKYSGRAWPVRIFAFLATSYPVFTTYGHTQTAHCNNFLTISFPLICIGKEIVAMYCLRMFTVAFDVTVAFKS